VLQPPNENRHGVRRALRDSGSLSQKHRLQRKSKSSGESNKVLPEKPEELCAGAKRAKQKKRGQRSVRIFI